MYRVILSVFLSILISSGCNTNEPFIEDTSDEVTINSDNSAFSFSYGKAFSIPDTNNIKPDIIVLVHTDQNNNVLGVFFGTDSLRPAFNLIGTFTDIDSAKDFFYNLKEVPDSNYNSLAIPVNPYQVWAVKTNENKYGKILILFTDAYVYSPSPGFIRYYAEARFKWKFQINGSRYF